MTSRSGPRRRHPRELWSRWLSPWPGGSACRKRKEAAVSSRLSELISGRLVACVYVLNAITLVSKRRRIEASQRRPTTVFALVLVRWDVAYISSSSDNNSDADGGEPDSARTIAFFH